MSKAAFREEDLKREHEAEEVEEAKEALTHFEVIVCCEDEPRSQNESQLSEERGRTKGAVAGFVPRARGPEAYT